jgi:hypothetical protein
MTGIIIGGRSRPTFVTSMTSDEIADVIDLVQKVNSIPKRKPEDEPTPGSDEPS